MADETPPPVRARRWIPPPAAKTAKPSQFRSYRFMLRLIALPVLAVAGVFIYQGLRDRMVLPECDSDRAKHTLADVLKQLKLEPAKYAPLKTVSSTKDNMVCSAVMPLPEGGFVAVDYTFYWQGNNSNMKYSVSKKATDDSDITPPAR
jgi:hypothetical protein